MSSNASYIPSAFYTTVLLFAIYQQENIIHIYMRLFVFNFLFNLASLDNAYCATYRAPWVGLRFAGMSGVEGFYTIRLVLTSILTLGVLPYTIHLLIVTKNR